MPVSVVLGQPALRAARKSCSPLAHSPHLCAARAALICTTARLHLSPPLRFRGGCSCLFIQRLALRLSWTENSRGRGEFQCTQLGYWVDGCFGGADLTVFSCGKHKHTVGQSVLVVQTHTNRLSHFSFFLPANFLHLLFSFLLTFCTCFFPFFFKCPIKQFYLLSTNHKNNISFNRCKIITQHHK